MLAVNTKVTDRLFNNLNNPRSYNCTIRDYADKVGGFYQYAHRYSALYTKYTKPLWLYKHQFRSKSFSRSRRIGIIGLDENRISYYNNLPCEECPL